MAYRRRVVGERLQVSDVGVDESPRALDVHAHVVVGGVGDGDSRTEADTSSEAYHSRPAGGGVTPLTCIDTILFFFFFLHARSLGTFLLQELMCFQADSHDEDGRGHEGGGVEPSLTVGVLPLSLVHLASAVLAAPAHAETRADDGREDHDQDSDRRAYEEPHLVVDPLRVGGKKGGVSVSTRVPFVSFLFSGMFHISFTCSNRTTFSGCRREKQMRRGQISSTHQGSKVAETII